MSQDTNDTNEANQYRTSRTQEQIDRLDRVQDALAPYFNRLRPGESQWRAVRDAILDGKIDVPNNDAPVGAMAESQAQMASAWNAVFHVIRDVNGGSFPVRHDTKGNELTARDTAVEYIRELAKLDAFNDRVIERRDHLERMNGDLAKRISGGLDTTIRNAIANDEPHNWKYLQCRVRTHPNDAETLQIDEIMVRKDGFLPNFGQNVPASTSPSENTVTPSGVDAALIELSAVDLAFNEAIDTISAGHEPDVLSLCTAQSRVNSVRVMLHDMKRGAPLHHFDGALGSTTFGDDNTAVIPPDGLWTWNLGHGVIAEATFVDHEGHICVVLHEADEQVTPGDRVARKPNSPGVMLRFKDSGAAVHFASRILSKA